MRAIASTGTLIFAALCANILSSAVASDSTSIRFWILRDVIQARAEPKLFVVHSKPDLKYRGKESHINWSWTTQTQNIDVRLSEWHAAGRQPAFTTLTPCATCKRFAFRLPGKFHILAATWMWLISLLRNFIRNQTESQDYSPVCEASNLPVMRSWNGSLLLKGMVLSSSAVESWSVTPHPPPPFRGRQVDTTAAATPF